MYKGVSSREPPCDMAGFGEGPSAVGGERTAESVLFVHIRRALTLVTEGKSISMYLAMLGFTSRD